MFVIFTFSLHLQVLPDVLCALEWSHLVLGVSDKLKPCVLDIIGPIVRWLFVYESEFAPSVVLKTNNVTMAFVILPTCVAACWFSLFVSASNL